MSIKLGAQPLAGISISDLTRNDVVDNLLSDAADLPLSARMGGYWTGR